MPYTTRKRLNKQDVGTGVSTWGTILNTGVFDVADFAMDGWTTLAVSADHTLSTADGTTTANEAGARTLKLTTAAATYIQTLPAREGWYLVWNASTAAQTIACAGGGTSATIYVGEVVFVVCDATNVKRMTLLTMSSARLQDVADPTSAQDAATKAYVDAQAFAALVGDLPGQAGNAGKFLTTDGSAASWGYSVTIGAGLASVANDTLTVTAAAAADVRGGVNTSKAVTAGALTNSAAFGTLTDAATVAWEIATIGYNAAVTLGGNRTIGAPTLNAGSLYDGCCVCLELIQDGTGSRVPTWNSVWDWGAAGTPLLQTAAAKRDLVFGIYRSATSKIHATFRKGA